MFKFLDVKSKDFSENPSGYVLCHIYIETSKEHLLKIYIPYVTQANVLRSVDLLEFWNDKIGIILETHIGQNWKVQNYSVLKVVVKFVFL